jgi:hypothetical protein
MMIFRRHPPGHHAVQQLVYFESYLSLSNLKAATMNPHLSWRSRLIDRDDAYIECLSRAVM